MKAWHKLAVGLGLGLALLVGAAAQATMDYGYGYRVDGVRPQGGRFGGDAGLVPDAGLWLAAIVTGPSYFHSGGGTAQTRVWTDASVSDAGELLAYQTLDGGTVAAVDNTVGVAASIGAIRAAAETTGSPWVLIDWEQPQTASWNYDLAALETNITAAAARALDAGTQLCPVGHWEVVGGYYAEGASLPFLDGGTGFAPDSGSHLELIRRDITERLSTHLATLTDGGGIAPGCETLKYYDLKGPHSGTTTALVQAAYSQDFYDYTAYAPLFDTSGVEVQSDGLHFTQAGHRHAADMLGRTFVRAATAGTATRFVPTSASVVDGENIDVTLTVPCRVHGGCVDDPPITEDVAGRVAQETQGGVATEGLHFWSGGSLVAPPNPVSAVTPQSCPSGSSCVVRFTFAGGLPSFDGLSFGDVYCKVFANADCSFGPAGIYGGGSNLVTRVNTTCNALPDGGTHCYEAPTYNRFAVSYDAGVAVDAGFAASNTQYLVGTSADYVSVTGTGGGTSACVSAWADAPALASNAHIVGPTANLRLDMREISSSFVCAATNTPGATFRTFATTPTAGTRHHWACCFDPTLGLHVWLDGAADDGSFTGSGTALQADGTFRWPQVASGSLDVDEVMFFPGKTTFTPATDLLQVRCATKAATDSSPTSGECSGVTTDVPTICSTYSGLRWYGMEGDATDRCGVLAGSETGTPPYTSY